MQTAQTKQQPNETLGAKWLTAASDLTAYALACGYIQQFEQADKRVTLWHEGGPVYHVRAHDFKAGQRLTWETFETLTAARKYWRKMRTYIKMLDDKKERAQ